MTEPQTGGSDWRAVLDRTVTEYRARTRAIAARTGDRDAEAESLDGQGDTYLAAGDRDAALAGWRLALAIREDLRDPDADRIRVRIDRVDGRG